MQRGRLREFWQLNVDIFGVESSDAELEMIEIIDALFQSFKAKRSTYQIKINSRLLIQNALQKYGLKPTEVAEVIRLIDRMSKMKPTEFAEKLDNLTSNNETSKAIIAFLSVPRLEDLEDSLLQLESTKSLQKILDECKSLGISNVAFDPALMRGFDYYTDIVFEVFDTDPENNRSMFGGGRYDGLVGQFGVDPVPTVGFGMGDVTFQNFLESHNLVPNLHNTNELTILLRDDSLDVAKKVARELRDEEVNTAIDYSARKLDKQLKSAVKSGVRYVLFVGSEEVNEELF
jgi:histidyl-tRNA synthetase